MMLRRLKNRVVSAALQRFADWALSKNAPGGYQGEDDKRWAYTIQTDGRPYLTRILLSRLFRLRELLNVGIYVHKFHRPDADPWPHNHPWKKSLSVILTGEYLEERVDQVIPRREIDRFWGFQKVVREVLTDTKVVRLFNYLTSEDYHRILELRGDVWTLFITGAEVQDWGFLVDGVHVPHANYFDSLKKAAA